MHRFYRQMTDIERALQKMAAAERLLVVLDFDGTLAPIVQRPELASPVEGTQGILLRLVATGASVVLLSGRGLEDLRRQAQPPDHVLLVGGHGAEWAGEVVSIDGRLLQDVVDSLAKIASQDEGAFLEIKQYSVALHYRRVSPVTAARMVNEAMDGPGQWKGVKVTLGKRVLELSLTQIDKGSAINRLRAEHQSQAVLFIGDDTSDEDAFAVLGPADLGIKVGEGHSLATHRVESPQAVVRLLDTLADLRQRSP